MKEWSYAESVKFVGLKQVAIKEEEEEFAPAHGKVGAKPWDGGEEEDEDDGMEKISTDLLGHAPGWTMFERLYIFNDSFYVVT